MLGVEILRSADIFHLGNFITLVGPNAIGSHDSQLRPFHIIITAFSCPLPLGKVHGLEMILEGETRLEYPW